MRVVELKNIVKNYHAAKDIRETKALRRISLSLEKGEFVGVMGPSGSGKTTLLNIASGIDNATSGTAKINGTILSDLPKDGLALFRRQEMGFVFQDFNLLDSLSVKENIMLPMILEKKPLDFMERQAGMLMGQFGIDDIANKYPYHISGGQQQRVAVCRALVNEPSILFADEPTGNLDSKSSKGIMRFLREINEELGTTIFLVTHDVFAASYCKKVIFIRDGQLDSQILRKGSQKEFLKQIMDNLAILGGGGHDF